MHDGTKLVFTCSYIIPSHYHHYVEFESFEYLKYLSGMPCPLCVLDYAFSTRHLLYNMMGYVYSDDQFSFENCENSNTPFIVIIKS